MLHTTYIKMYHILYDMALLMPPFIHQLRWIFYGQSTCK